MALSPAMSTFLAFIFLDERITIFGFVGIFITIFGIALVVLERDTNSKYKITSLGIIYGLLGAFGQAAGLLFAKFAFNEGHITGFVATFIRVFSSVIIFLPIMFLLKKYKNPYKVFTKDKSAFGVTLLGTILGPFLGITFSLIAVENTKVGIAATLMSTMPIIMLPMVKYVYKEKLSWRSIAGAVIAVLGVALIFLR
jgi:drug/metabolite transporter (DMT)-like permease